MHTFVPRGFINRQEGLVLLQLDMSRPCSLRLIQLNEWGFRSSLCTCRLNWAKRTSPEDGEMNEMTLASRHSIQNSNPSGLRPGTLPLGNGGSPQHWIFASERGRNNLFHSTWRPEWGSNPRSPTFQAGSFNRCTRATARSLR